MKHITCDICGADILAKSGGTFICTGCGMQYDRERILEMAAQSQEKTAQAEQAVLEEPLPVTVEDPIQEEPMRINWESPVQKKKFPARKQMIEIGLAAAGVVVLLAVMLSLMKTPKTEVPAPVEKEPAAAAVRNPVEEEIQGLWYYEDPEIGWHEEHYFCGGLVASITWLDSAPEKASNGVGEYEVLDGQVRRRSLETDYVLYYDYYYEDGELVLSWYIDSGRGAGSSRVYRKISDSSSPKTFIPENFSGSSTNQTAKETVTSGMKNALKKAETYLQIMAFSRQGLIDQLEFDGFTYGEAAYAADACGADWYQQAVKRAQNYLEIMSFSRQGLIDQLEYDGFLYDQAVRAVEKVY